MAFVYGRIGEGKNILTRLHRADVIGDVFGGAKTINAVLQRFKDDGRGVIVYLRDGTAGVPVTAIPRDGETESEAARIRQWREIGLGAQILKDLGISSIRLVTSKKLTYVGPWRLRYRDRVHRGGGRLSRRFRRLIRRGSIHCSQCPAAARDGGCLRSPAVIALLSVRRQPRCASSWRLRICEAAPVARGSADTSRPPRSMSSSCWRSTFPIPWIRTSWRCSARATCKALTSSEFLNALRQGIHGKIAVTYFEWAGAQRAAVVVPWRVIDGPESADSVASEITRAPIRRAARTSISGALLFGMELFETSGQRGIRRVIDVSGDGANNSGQLVTVARDEVVSKGITINGLPVMLKRPSYSTMDIELLDEYYEDCVIGGPAAFVVPVKDRDKFVEAIRTKLVLEIATADAAARVMKASATNPRVPCTVGERIWQERWGN